MKESLQAGLSFRFQFQVPETKTVPHLYRESQEFQVMPKVLATGYMVGCSSGPVFKQSTRIWTGRPNRQWGLTCASTTRRPRPPV